MLASFLVAFVVLVLGAMLIHRNTVLSKARLEGERSQTTLELEEQSIRAAEQPVALAERELELARGRLSLEADAELASAEKLELAANKRLAAAEADAKAQVVAATVAAQIAAEHQVIAAHTKALEDAAVVWAKSQPAPQRIKDPIESVDLNALYKSYLDTAYKQSVRALPFGQWLGENYRKAVNSASKR